MINSISSSNKNEKRIFNLNTVTFSLIPIRFYSTGDDGSFSEHMWKMLYIEIIDD